ncbi:MAG: alpha/beta fold hydrolase [Ilumatobacteraceae bacterium]
MPMLDRDGVAIHYEVAGAGPGLILTHGFAASAGMFAEVVEPLSASHTVITWDQRGHGRSDYPVDPAAYSPELAVADLAALLDAADVEAAVVGGHSLGGYLSFEFLLTHPSRTLGLVLIDTGPGFRNDDARAGWNRYADKIASTYEAKGLVALAGSEELDPSVHRDTSGLVLAARHVLKQHDGRVMEELATISVPALVLVGADDAQFMGGSEYMAAKIPGAELAVIEGAGHAPPVSQPAAFTEAVLGFMGRHDL